MTTVVFKNGVLYADTRLTITNLRSGATWFKEADKILRVGNDLVASAGCSFMAQKMQSKWNKFCIEKLGFAFFNALGMPWKAKHHTDLTLIVKEKCSVFLVMKRIDFLYFMFVWVSKRTVIEHDRNCFSTFGSGADYAYKHLDDGFTPEEAIVYASKFDDGTNDKITKKSRILMLTKDMRVC